MANKVANKLLWIDLEMTGLNVEKEVVIEVAALISDLQLKPIEQYHAIVKQPQRYLEAMDEWNKKHHGESGLTQLVPTGKSPEQVEDDLLKLIETHFKDERPMLAGNSIAQDRLFIDKYFVRFAQKLHYRMLDVSSWKIVFNNFYNLKYEKKNTHRAVEDILESMAELKFYLGYIKP